MPILGETPEVSGLWSARRGLGQGGPGRRPSRWPSGWCTASRRSTCTRPTSPASASTRRPARTSSARASEGFNKTYGIVHPSEQWASNRNVRLSPFHAREQELGAVFFEAAGWERPHWYESNAPLLEEYGDRVKRREAEWDARWWSPIINAEHLAMRDRAGDVRPVGVRDLRRRRAGRARAPCSSVAMRQMDVPVGRVVYTPVLTPGGGFKADLTIMRLGDELLPRRHRRRPRHGRPASGSATTCPRTAAPRSPTSRRPGRRSACGARARATSSSALTRDDVSHEGFPFGRCRTIEVGHAARAGLAHLLRRRPRLGAVRPDRAGRAAVGHHLGGRPAARRRPGRDRRLRHDRPAREVLPRATASSWTSEYNVCRGGHGLGQGEGRGLRRQGGARAPPRGGAGRGHVHAHRRRPHLGLRREALHARPRADPDPRRQAADRQPRAAART